MKPILITLLFLSLNSFSQKKKECGNKLDSNINYFSGQWKFIYSDLFFIKGGQEKRICSNHILSIDKSKFSVRRHTDSIAYQTGKIKIKKDNPAKKGNCELLVYFKPRGEKLEYAPEFSWDIDSYHIFWLIEKCNSDSLTLYSPWTQIATNKNGMLVRHYARIK
jgi:hypothetical protein